MHEHGYLVTNLSFRTSNMYDANIDSVVPEARVGEQLLLQHLCDLGHRRIGYIYGVANHEVLSDRLTILLEIQRDLGIPVVEEWIYRCGPTTIDGYHATLALLASCQGKERPSALIAVNDLLATGVLAALAHQGVRVPAEMSVASFDNAPLAPFTVPALTTVDYDARAMGEKAARLTLERLAAPDRPSIFVEMPAKLVVRSSTGPCQG